MRTIQAIMGVVLIPVVLLGVAAGRVRLADAANALARDVNWLLLGRVS